MTLDKEIAASAKEIYTDGYDMSIGEVVSLYKENELIINPEYQRLFRWDDTRKTRFIESILLGIPIPPIFVFQNSDGTWELVDGLQRLSTILEFMGILRDSDDNVKPPSILGSTNLLPSLGGKVWDEQNESSIGRAQQLSIRRARIRLEILKKESDQQIKYELFQRLNTGGVILTDQEIRNSIMLMIKPELYKFVEEISLYEPFKNTLALSDRGIREQRPMELIIRIFIYKLYPYMGKIDVNEYLDKSLEAMMRLDLASLYSLRDDFKDTFDVLNFCLANNAFKKFSDGNFTGAFSIAAYEAITYGFFCNIRLWKEIDRANICDAVYSKVAGVWSDPVFIANSGAGVRGTTRISNLIPHSLVYFVP